MYRPNFLFSTDSYKCSHHLLYPPETNYMFAYLESRVDSLYDRTVFFGGQALLNEYLTHKVAKEEVEEAKAFYAMHGVPFPYEGWMKVVTKYNGYLPVRIRMPLEGSVIPISNALATVESMDPELYWLVTWIETFFLRGLWYPITVSTVSWHCKKIILEHLLATSDDPYEQVKFKLHDFGARGVSSGESAGLGGMAHLVNFYGSDTVEGIAYANHFYHEDMAAFSIPASEHSTIISWGKDHEADAYENMLDRFGGGAIFACVSDSYDIYNAVEHIWGEKLREKVLASKAMLVVRPDSGDPKTVVVNTLGILADKFGFTLNSKGYKVLNHVRLIQGDGVEHDSLREVCEHVKKHGFSIDNIAFGMGGGLLQKLDRDTQRFAYKVSTVKVGDEYRIVQKSPATDMTKASKGGLLVLTKNAQGEYKTETLPPAEYSHAKENGKAMPKNLLEVVYEGGGKVLRDDTLAAIRERTLEELKLAISKETRGA